MGRVGPLLAAKVDLGVAISGLGLVSAGASAGASAAGGGGGGPSSLLEGAASGFGWKSTGGSHYICVISASPMEFQPMFEELPPPVRQFVTACILLELVSLGGSISGFGSNVRNVLLVLGGFWPAIFTGAVPFFPGQGILMFATSAVLHGNPIHLGMNIFGLIWLGPMAVDRLGDRGFWPLAGLSTLGAGSCYALMTNSTLPMVGASGVLYGLLGAVCLWTVLDQRERGRSLMHYAAPAAIFFGFNVLLMLPARGQIAWEAHLGGFLAGVLCGVMTWRGTLR